MPDLNTYLNSLGRNEALNERVADYNEPIIAKIKEIESFIKSAEEQISVLEEDEGYEKQIAELEILIYNKETKIEYLKKQLASYKN